MSRIVNNKHFNTSSGITFNSFVQLGEIIVCNETGYEGLYILNLDHQPVRIGAWTGDIEADLETLKRELKEEIEQWAESQFASQAEIDNLQQQIDEIVITPINEARVREIANEEIEKIVDSATTYDTLYKIEQWIINSGSTATIDPQLIEDVEELKSLSAGTRLDNLEAVSAETRIHRLEDKIDGISKSTDHFVMNYQEYQQLRASGSVVINNETVVYRDDYFYCIYEGEGPEPTPEPGSGDTQPQYVSGDTITLADQENSDLDNHILEITYSEFNEETGLLVLDEGGNDSEESSGGDVSGSTATPDNSEYVEPGQQDATPPYIEMEINNITDGIVDTDWEIDGN